MKDPSICLRVRGDYALFSRPEFKVERVSYGCPTPSAMRGVLEAVYWKPEIKYRIRRIGVVRLGTPTTVLRNELGNRQGKTPIYVEDDRQQRSSLILKNVEYLIHADIPGSATRSGAGEWSQSSGQTHGMFQSAGAERAVSSSALSGNAGILGRV